MPHFSLQDSLRYGIPLLTSRYPNISVSNEQYYMENQPQVSQVIFSSVMPGIIDAGGHAPVEVVDQTREVPRDLLAALECFEIAQEDQPRAILSSLMPGVVDQTGPAPVEVIDQTQEAPDDLLAAFERLHIADDHIDQPEAVILSWKMPGVIDGNGPAPVEVVDQTREAPEHILAALERLLVDDQKGARNLR